LDLRSNTANVQSVRTVYTVYNIQYYYYYYYYTKFKVPYMSATIDESQAIKIKSKCTAE